MRRFIGGKFAARILAVVLVLAVWKTLTLFYPPLIVPEIFGVAARLVTIAASAKAHAAMLVTLERLAAGLALGVGAGAALGLLLGASPRIRRVGEPLLGLAQSVPPVSWLVLALLWFGFNGRPSVFIVALSILPVLTVNLVEGFANIDGKLLQMAEIYGFSRGKRLRRVVAPSIFPYFRSGLRIGVGNGCKAVIMGEVLTTSNGIGGAITDARLNLDPEGVVAWTVVMALLYYLLDCIAVRLLRRKRGRPC